MYRLEKYFEMQNPCVANCGHTYEGEELDKLIEKAKKCTLCGVRLNTAIPNLVFKEVIRLEENESPNGYSDDLHKSIEDIRKDVNFILETQHYLHATPINTRRSKRIHSERFLEFKDNNGIFTPYPDPFLDDWLRNRDTKKEREQDETVVQEPSEIGCCVVQ